MRPPCGSQARGRARSRRSGDQPRARRSTMPARRRRRAPSRSTSTDGRHARRGDPRPAARWLAVGPCHIAGRRARRLSASSSCPSSRSSCSPRSRSSTPPTSSPNDTRRSISSTRSARSSAARSRSRKRRARSSAKSRETVGARRASILVHDRATNTLHAVAALGAEVAQRVRRSASTIRAASPRACSARSTRCSSSRTRCCRDARRAIRRGAMLSVPIMWTAPHRRREPLGVVNLSDRRSGQPFTAGDQKLVTAIATQIGTAIQNARLVRASLDQQRLAQEMQLAHDLQMKLLPTDGVVAPEAKVAARVVPAESVGGDFYKLFRLGDGQDRRDDRRRVGTRLSGGAHHGADDERVGDPRADDRRSRRDAARAALDRCAKSWTTTEMFISMFYGVVDPRRRRAALREHRASARVRHRRRRTDASGLPASDPPLGMGDAAAGTDAPAVERRPRPAACSSPTASAMRATAGASGSARSGCSRSCAQHRDEPPARFSTRVFAVLEEHTARRDPPRRPDARRRSS